MCRFSHVWLLFEFHANNSESVKPKVQPPRLDGRRVGLFSTRTPHRPNAIGLSLVAIDSIDGDTITFSGVDVRFSWCMCGSVWVCVCVIVCVSCVSCVCVCVCLPFGFVVNTSLVCVFVVEE